MKINLKAWPHHNEIMVSVALIVCYLALSSIKMKEYLLTGRIWAEEGTFFYKNINELSIFRGFFYIYNGHLELVTNFISILATRINFKFAPLITTYGSFIFQSLPILYLILLRKYIGIKNTHCLLLVAVFCGIPQSIEVWANSVNLHFYFTILGALILASFFTTKKMKYMGRLLLLLCGLSGVPPNFLTPVYFYKAIISKNRECWVQFLIILTTSIIQLTLLLNNFDSIQESGVRHFEFNPWVYWQIIVNHEFISPLIGFRLSEVIYLIIIKLNIWIYLVSYLIISVAIIILINSLLNSSNPNTKYILYSACVVSLLSILTSQGSKADYIAPIIGVRYFYAPTFFISLSIAMQKDIKFLSYSLIYLYFVAFTSLINTPNFLSGPPWEAEYKKSATQNLDSVNIWPHGWIMKFHHD